MPTTFKYVAKRGAHYDILFVLENGLVAVAEAGFLSQLTTVFALLSLIANSWFAVLVREMCLLLEPREAFSMTRRTPLSLHSSEKSAHAKRLRLRPTSAPVSWLGAPPRLPTARIQSSRMRQAFAGAQRAPILMRWANVQWGLSQHASQKPPR